MQKQGFTIIETLVAIAVLTTAIIGTMSAVQSGIRTYTLSKEQVTAFYLAQEGFEQLRNMRDENSINGRHWLYGIAQNASDPCYFGQSCMADPIGSTTLTRCPSAGNCVNLRQDTASGFFGYNASWAQSNFKRDIMLTSITTDEAAVAVTISWPRGSSTITFKVKENLLNW